MLHYIILKKVFPQVKGGAKSFSQLCKKSCGKLVDLCEIKSFTQKDCDYSTISETFPQKWRKLFLLKSLWRRKNDLGLFLWPVNKTVKTKIYRK